MQEITVVDTARRDLDGVFRVDLPLDKASLNERLYEIGLWLIERHIPHQAHIRWKPLKQRICISFHQAEDAGAFRKRFGMSLH